MNSLLVPSLGLDDSLLERLAQSIDIPFEAKLVINNGPKGGLDEFHRRHTDWAVLDMFNHNAGVSASWNMAPRTFQGDSWLICNEDVRFHPGALEVLRRVTRGHAATAPIIMLNESNPFYAFVWTRRGVEEFGLFDENFWPGYYEDCDMRVRHRLAGVQYVYAFPGWPGDSGTRSIRCDHGKPKTGGDNYSALINGSGLFARAYWLRKWGDLNFERALFKTPYNDPSLTWRDWTLDLEHRIKIRPLWETFISMPGASVYT